MKDKIYNNWRKISSKYGSITIFRIYWQFDCYTKCVEIEIFNFIISIG